MTGASAVVAEKYPISGGHKNDETGDIAEFELLAPIEIAGPINTKLYRQDVQLKLESDDSRVAALADEVLSEIVDTLAFVSGYPQRFSLPSLTTAPPGVTEGPYRTMLMMQPVEGSQHTFKVGVDYLFNLWRSVDDIDSERGRHIVRAMRWYRRSVSTIDEFERFSCLAFRYESLTTLLPALCERSALGKQRKKGVKPDTATILRTYAIHQAKIKEEDWKRVSGFRHQLFHGGLTENIGSREQLAATLPILRSVVAKAIKELIGIPEAALPATKLPPVVIMKPTPIFQGVIRLKPD